MFRSSQPAPPPSPGIISNIPTDLDSEFLNKKSMKKITKYETL
jgi:hypothetical protein